MIGVGLIGLGRVGRGLLRELHTRGGALAVTAVAEINPCCRDAAELTANLAYLLAHDTLYGPFPGRVAAEGASLAVDGRAIPVTYSPDPCAVDWRAAGAAIVVEASGDPAAAARAPALIASGVPKVVITRSAGQADATIVRGLNLDAYDPALHHVVSCSTCTANALAPVLGIIHRAYGVARGNITTVHPALSGDTILDAPAREFQMGRSGHSVRPVGSEVANTTSQLIPELAGRLTAMSLRVPSDRVNCLTADLLLERPPAGPAEVAELLARACRGELAGVVELEEGFLGRPRVAADFLGRPASALVDLNWLELNGPLLRLLLWHDNEYAYCARVADTLEVIAGRL